MPSRSSVTEPPATALLGEAFAHAIARRDDGQLVALLHPEVEFRALTPRRAWEPQTRAEALEVVRTWFWDCDITEVRVQSSEIGERAHVSYRFAGERPAGRFLIEQHAYHSERDGAIGWIRILCSGFAML